MEYIHIYIVLGLLTIWCYLISQRISKITKKKNSKKWEEENIEKRLSDLHTEMWQIQTHLGIEQGMTKTKKED